MKPILTHGMFDFELNSTRQNQRYFLLKIMMAEQLNSNGQPITCDDAFY